MAVTQMLPASAAYAWLRAFELRTRTRIGAEGAEGNLGLRFHQRQGFSQEPRVLWREADDDGPAALVWDDYGLLAPHGPMPDRLTELVLHAPDGPVVAAFLDLLVQRLARLHYRAWAQLRPECEVGHADDRFSRVLRLLAGGEFAMPHLAWRPPPASALQALAQRRLSLKLQVRREVVRWHENPQPAVLGRARLAQHLIGCRVPLYGGPHAKVLLQVFASDIFQLARLRDFGSGLMQALFSLARQCLGSDARIALRIIAPACLPAARLGSSVLGRTRLNKGQLLDPD